MDDLKKNHKHKVVLNMPSMEYTSIEDMTEQANPPIFSPMVFILKFMAILTTKL